MEKSKREIDYKQAYHELVNKISDVVHHDLSYIIGGQRFYEPVAQELLAGVERSRENLK